MSQNWRGNDWTASNWDGNNWLGPNEEAPAGSISANLVGSGTMVGVPTAINPQQFTESAPVGGNRLKHRTKVDSGPDTRELALKRDDEEVMWLLSFACQTIFTEDEMWEH